MLLAKGARVRWSGAQQGRHRYVSRFLKMGKLTNNLQEENAGQGSKLGWKLAKKGNRGIVLTEVPRSQSDLPLHSAALAPRLFYPIIVGNLLLAGDNTKKMQECFCPVNVYKYFAAVLNSRPAWVKDIIWNDIDPGVLKNCKGLQKLSSVHCHFIQSITIRFFYWKYYNLVE